MNSTEEKIIYPRVATVSAAVVAVVFCVVGVLGNLITILALIRCPKLRAHATTAFVLSLCISDLLFCSVNLPLTASRYFHESWIFGDTLCKLFPVFFYGNVAVSLLNMVAITLNRYVLITCNQYYSILYSKLSICIQLVCVWGIAFLIMLPPLLNLWGRLGLYPPTFSCTILEKDGKSPKKVIFLIGFVLPCTVIIIAYSCIYCSVRKARDSLNTHQVPSARRNSRREKEDSRLTKLMAIIFLGFVLCFLPLMIANVFDDNIQYPVVNILASIMAWASSVINPFIYALSNRQYRAAYKKLWKTIQTGIVFSESRHNHMTNSIKSRNFEKNAKSNSELP